MRGSSSDDITRGQPVSLGKTNKGNEVLLESLPEQTGLIVYLVICVFIYFLEKFPFHKPTCKPQGRFYNFRIL